MSCKDPRKAVCINKYKTLQEVILPLKVLVVFRCLLPLEFLQIRRWLFTLRMDERWLWDVHTPCRLGASASSTCWFIALCAFLNSVMKRTHLSVHSFAGCYSPSSLRTQSPLVCWGFLFWVLISTYRPVRCWWQQPHCKEETSQTFVFPVCRFPGMLTTGRWGMRDVCADMSGWETVNCVPSWNNKVVVPLFCYRIYVSCSLNSVLKLFF